MTKTRSGLLLALLVVAQAAHADFFAPAPLDPVDLSRDPLHDMVVDLAVSPDGAQIYALEGRFADTGPHVIGVLARDGATGRLTLSNAAGLGLAGKLLTMAPDGRHIYVGVDSFQSPGLRIVTRDTLTGALSAGPAVTGAAFSGDGVAVSPDGEHVYVANGFGPGDVRVFARDTVTGALTFVETETDGVGGVDGIWEPQGIVVSPDGAYVYVGGRADSAIAIFARDAGTGALTFLDVVRDGVGGVAGLLGVTRLTVSPDGAHLYTVSVPEAGDVAVFSRNAGTGALTFVEVKHNGVGGVTGMTEPFRVLVSPDGAHVYVLVRSYTLAANGVVIFTRNASTGALTFVATEQSGGSGRHLAMAMPGTGTQVYVGGHAGVDTFDRNAGTGLLASVEAIVAGRPRQIAVSPDGAHVYAIGERTDDTYGRPFVATWARDALDGSVSLVETLVQGATGITSLSGATGIVVSPDGAHVYVTAQLTDEITVFERAVPAGTLTVVQTVQDGVGGVDGLDGAGLMALSPDGASLYVTSALESSVALFARNALTGELSFVEVQRDGVAGVDGLQGAGWVVVSGDGAHVYVSGAGEDAIAIFARDSGSGVLSFLGTVREGVGGVSGLDAPFSIVLSPDDLYLYVTGAAGGTIAAFARDTLTGLLSFVEAKANGLDGMSGIGGELAMTPDGTHVYASSGAVFVRDGASGALGFVERTPVLAGSIALSPSGDDAYLSNEPGVSSSFGAAPASMLQHSARGFSGCDPAPLAGCRPAGRGRIRILTTGRPLLVWSYSKGGATDLADLGDPRDRTHYALCAYEGASPVLALRALAPAGGVCRPTSANNDRSCWTDTRTGFRYRDDFKTPEGLFTAKLKTGAAGKSVAKVRGIGEHVRIPALPLTLPVRVQLQAANGECWETTHSSANANDDSRFIASSD